MLIRKNLRTVMIIRIDIPEYDDKKAIKPEDYDLSDFLYCLSLEFLRQGHRVINGYSQKTVDKAYDIHLINNFNSTYARVDQDPPGTVVVSLVDKILKPTECHNNQLAWYSMNHEYYRRMTQSDGDIFYTNFINDFWKTIAVYNKTKYNVIPPAFDPYILENFWYGDDGEACGEPSFTIKSQNFKDQTITIFITKTGLNIGCYETYYTCELSYITNKGHIELLPLDTGKSCYQD